MDKIRILLVDDHTLFRESLRSHLSGFENLEVVGEAGDGNQACDKTVELKPDVILMDFAMPGLNGLQATRRIRQMNPSVKILILTMYETGPQVQEILKAGASGYILKKSPTQDLISAIKAVSQGDAFLCPSVAKQVLEGYVKKEEDVNIADNLTPRELDLIRLIAEGNTNKAIASLWNISINTVETHRFNLMKKLNAHDSTQIVLYAIRKGLISP